MPLRDDVEQVVRQLRDLQGQQLQLVQTVNRMVDLKPQNGRSVGNLIFWMLSLCVMCLIAMGGAYASYVNGKITSYDAIVASRGERLTVLETNYVVIQQRLEKMDNKLDTLISYTGRR